MGHSFTISLRLFYHEVTALKTIAASRDTTWQALVVEAADKIATRTYPLFREFPITQGVAGQYTVTVSRLLSEKLAALREKYGIPVSEMVRREVMSQYLKEIRLFRQQHPDIVRLSTGEREERLALAKSTPQPRGLPTPKCAGRLCRAKELKMFWRSGNADYYCCNCRNTVTPAQIKQALKVNLSTESLGERRG